MNKLNEAQIKEILETTKDFSGCNLEDANLTDANLRDANLIGANLFNTVGNNKEIFTFQLKEYTINIHKDRIQIGCKNYSYEEWKNFSNEEIDSMDSKALEWWKENKDFVLNYYLHLNK